MSWGVNILCRPPQEIPGDKVTQWGQLGGETIPMEAVVLTKLKRVAGVIRILDVGVDGDKYIIVMERPTRVRRRVSQIE